MVRVFLHSGSSAPSAATPAWAIVLVGFAAATILLFFLFVGTILAMVVAPFAIGLALVARWRLRRFVRDLETRRNADAMGRTAPEQIIDADYRVVDDGDRD
jgi:membrane protein implicated in regulation of membrane protease activity